MAKLGKIDVPDFVHFKKLPFKLHLVRQINKNKGKYRIKNHRTRELSKKFTQAKHTTNQAVCDFNRRALLSKIKEPGEIGPNQSLQAL
jgi:hypothetical protein